MSRCCHVQGHRLVIRYPKTVVAFLTGVVFIAGGACAYHWRAQVASALEITPPWVLPVVCVGLVVIGFLAATLRTGAEIDCERQTVCRWAGPLFPLFKRVRRVVPQAVRLRSQSVTCRGQMTTWYPVTLMCVGGNIELGQPDAVIQAWAIAQNVANHLGVALYDETVNSASFAN